MDKKYRLKEGFTHYEEGPPTPTPAGTVVSMSDKRYHSLRDRFEPVEGSEVIEVPSNNETETLSSPPESPPKEDENDDSDGYYEWVEELESLTAKEAKATVSLLEEVDVLNALLAAESRITVVSAIEERLEELAS